MSKNKKISKFLLWTITLVLSLCSCGSNNSKANDNNGNIVTIDKKAENHIEEPLNQDAIEYGVARDHEFRIYSYQAIDNTNLYNYCVVLDDEESMVNLTVKPVSDFYLISKVGLYDEARTYDIYIGDEVFFKDYEKSVNHVRFTIEGEEREILTQSNSIVEVLNEDVESVDPIDDDTRSIVLKKPYYDVKNNTTFALVDYHNEPITDGIVQIYRALEVSLTNGVMNITATYPDLEDVYDDIDIYSIDKVEITEDMLSNSFEEEAEEILLKSPLFKAFDDAVSATNKEAKNKISGVRVKTEPSLKIGEKYFGIKTTIELYGKKETQDKKRFLEVKLAFVKEISFQLISTLKKNGLGMRGDFYLQTVADMAVELSIEYSATFGTNNGFKDVGELDPDKSFGDNFINNIKDLTLETTREKETINGKEKNESNMQSALSFLDKEMYADLEIPLLPAPIMIPVGIFMFSFTPQLVLNVNIDLILKGRLEEKITSKNGLRLDLKIGKCNTELIHDKTFQTNLEVYFSGKATIQFGILAPLMVSMVFCSWAFQIGLQIRLVLYAMLGGLAYINFVTGDKMLAGYFEVGLGIGIDLVAQIFWWKTKFEIIDWRIPFYRFGDKFAPLAFVADDEINTGSYLDIKKSLCQMTGLDTETCKHITKTVEPKKFKITMSEKDAQYFTMDSDYIIRLKDESEERTLHLTMNYDGEWNTVNVTKEFTIHFYPNIVIDTDNPEKLYIFRYDETNDAYFINQYFGAETLVEIPAEHNGKPVVGIDDGAFSSNQFIKSVQGESIKSIGAKAFYGCKKLKTATFDNCASLGESAFENCTALESIKLSNSLINVPQRCFNNCSSLLSFNFSSIQTIEENAFAYCNSLNNIRFGPDLKAIYSNAFAHCSSLTKVYLPYRNEGLAIFGSSFYKDNILVIVSLEDLNYYTDHLFTLSNCIISEEAIKNGFAYSYNDDGTVNLVKYLGDETETLEIPDMIEGRMVTTIGEDCFANCAFKSVIIPETINYIGSRAFKKCTRLASVTINNSYNVIKTGVNVFSDNASNLTIYVPEYLRIEYSFSAYWTWYRIRAI